jgi:hypothetical protein
MKKLLMSLLSVAGVAGIALGSAGWLRYGGEQAKVSLLERQISTKESQLLGYTSYTTFLALGKQSLGEQTKMLAATVSRDESTTQIVKRSLLGLESVGVVQTSQRVEYSFGYDLRPGSYDVVPTREGVEIRVGRPMLLAAPAVTDLRYQIVSGGLLTDEKAAVLRLYEEAATRAAQEGDKLASDPGVVALCEKKLAAFLVDFLSRQPNVKSVPAIRVVYQEGA